MERDLTKRYSIKTKELAELLLQMEDEVNDNPEDKNKDYRLKIGIVQLDNFEKLLGYPSFIYMTGLFLTEPDSFTTEKCSQKDYLDKRRRFLKLLQNKPTNYDIAVHNLMKTREGYEFLKEQIKELKKIIADINSLTTTMNFNIDVPPVKGLESIKSKTISLTISEYLEIKSTIENTIKELGQIKKVFATYSPVLYNKIIKDKYENNIERTYALLCNYDLPTDNEYYNKYTKIKKWFNENYPLYLKLKTLSKISLSNKEKYNRLCQELNKAGNIASQIIRQSILRAYQEYFPVFNNYFGTNINNIEYLSDNYKWYITEINSFIFILKYMIEQMNKSVDSLLKEKEKKQELIKKIMLDISYNSNVQIRNPYPLIEKDLMESYRIVNLHNTAKSMQIDATNELVFEYGNKADKKVYKLIPCK